MPMLGRVTIFQGDPDRIDAGLAYIKEKAAPDMAKLSGCYGIGAWVDRTNGISIVTSAWADEASLKAGELTTGGLRAEGARILGAHTVRTEILEPVFVQQNEPDQIGYHSRAVQVEIPADRIDEGVTNFASRAAPVILSSDGCTSLVQMVNRSAGRGFVVATYKSKATFDASRKPAEEMRAKQLAAINGRVVHIYETEVAHVGIAGPTEVPGQRTVQLPTETTV